MPSCWGGARLREPWYHNSMSNDLQTDTALLYAADRVKKIFVLGWPEGLEERLEQELASVSPDMTDIAQAFRDNLHSALTVATLPYQMAMAVVHETRSALTYSAERIRALNIEASDEERDRIARERAAAKLQGGQDDPPPPEMIRGVVNQLDRASQDPTFSATARELLLQCFVALWSSFEVLVGDLSRRHLNRQPKLAGKLLDDPNAKRHFPSKGLSVDALSTYDFDVSAVMGDLLFAERGIDSLPMMRDVCEVLLDLEEAARRSLHSGELWKLWQRRHLIVHRRGVVDAAYLAKSGDTLGAGQRLTLTADDIYQAAVILAELGAQLLRVPVRMDPVA